MDDITTVFDRYVSDGRNVVAVYITESSGSTPREAGAAMLVGEDGRIAGTIGGGALELECESLAADVLRTGLSTEKAFRLTEGKDSGELGMLCGGNVTVSLQFVDASDAESIRAAREALSGPAKERIWIFGAGHVAQALVPVLSSIGFDCIVLDDRPEYCSKELFPEAADVRLADLSDIAVSADIQPEDYVAIMTHGHAGDLAVQAQAMRTPAKYIGVIGSGRKTKALTEKLHEMGFTDADFANVYAPIGVPVPCETPAEIAVSIAAQLIAVRAGDLDAAGRARW